MRIGYKWKYEMAFRKSPEVHKYLPETHLYSYKKLQSMLDRHTTVVLKPSGGTGGQGVFKISKEHKDRYLLHHHMKRMLLSERRLQLYLDQILKKSTSHYMIQKCIPLLTINNQPCDVRVIVQRKHFRSPWVATATLAKVAGKNFFITNSRSRGTVYPLEEALKRAGLQAQARKVASQRLYEACLIAGKVLGKADRGMKISGFDMGIDRHLNVWIIEANPKPNFKRFKKMKDQSHYRRIMSYM
ncbi:YheC/YheD family protein [Mechercharimyces sp. CAU 1602]|uniref:YheC/YheD family protein n=1 Tax=Mechercharimyces sp. CAU 1602 TaxID=2973933 RepID=UPI0021633357|nr:YheC/YheD family protein [Mechercharimyces sp. CAU 1602]MCS1350417.1 YheC/YheD family protein [Mechercharimyces sp. CAU 1602]